MYLPYPNTYYRGAQVSTLWSSKAIVKDIYFNVCIRGRTFYGVRLEVSNDLQLDWPNLTSLVWVLDDGSCLRMWQNFSQPPLFTSNTPLPVIERIVGYVELNGVIFYAVVWRNYDTPTWQSETELGPYTEILTHNFRVLARS